MNKSRIFPFLLGAGAGLTFFSSPLLSQTQNSSSTFAILADIHLQDVYGQLESETFQGVQHPKNGKWATIRTMASQAKSTRLFNENYFAFLSALDDLAEQGIKLVILPGDYTDDGQPLNILALRKILETYAQNHGMRFFITPGNHDPVTPFGSPGGKSDYLGIQGQAQAVFSQAPPSSSDAAISSKVQHWGYGQIVQQLGAFGLNPNPKDIFWTHPFIAFDYEGYDFSTILTSATLDQRTYSDPTSGFEIPDVSYLVEPIEGIWLLALDANVFTFSGPSSHMDSLAWKGSSIGFNLASKSKNHQLEWIRLISNEAKKRGKTLISFSHYPLVDFHDGKSQAMSRLFGRSKFQLERVPDPETSKKYAEAGIQIHFAGHMHLNDTGIYQDSTHQTTLINVQAPSLAAFPPAYKTMRLTDESNLHIQTHLLEDVPNFDEFFDLYQLELNWIKANSPDTETWNPELLNANSYPEFTAMHLDELIRLRFIPADWPESLGILVQRMSEEQLVEWLQTPAEKQGVLLKSYLNTLQKSKQEGPLMQDFYFLKNGGDLGKNRLTESRKSLYQRLSKTQLPVEKPGILGQFANFLSILSGFYQGLPSGDFIISLDDLQVYPVSTTYSPTN